jgi:hypothetical protein
MIIWKPRSTKGAEPIGKNDEEKEKQEKKSKTPKMKKQMRSAKDSRAQTLADSKSVCSSVHSSKQVLSIRDVPASLRKKEAKQPLYLDRYE